MASAQHQNYYKDNEQQKKAAVHTTRQNNTYMMTWRFFLICHSRALYSEVANLRHHFAEPHFTFLVGLIFAVMIVLCVQLHVEHLLFSHVNISVQYVCVCVC